MISVSAVSYLNTKPFLYGIEKSGLGHALSLSLDMPSECARKLLSGEADLGLVPVAILPALGEYQLVSSYGIAADGPVDSVKLYGMQPLESIDEILLDYQSRTSVTLVRVLARDLWKKDFSWLRAGEGFETQIAGNRAAVVIGDRTFALNGKFPLEIDLAGAWKELTGLPFVFACWVSRKPLPEEFIRQFESALQFGTSHIPELVETLPADIRAEAGHYLQHSIHYALNPSMREALSLFLEKMKTLPALG